MKQKLGMALLLAGLLYCGSGSGLLGPVLVATSIFIFSWEPL